MPAAMSLPGGQLDLRMQALRIGWVWNVCVGGGSGGQMGGCMNCSRCGSAEDTSTRYRWYAPGRPHNTTQPSYAVMRAQVYLRLDLRPPTGAPHQAPANAAAERRGGLQPRRLGVVPARRALASTQLGGGVCDAGEASG